MSDEPRRAEEQSAKEPVWLLAPEEMPTGIRLHLSSVLEAKELTPEVLQALGHAVQGIQKSPKIIPPTCPKLRECGTYKDPLPGGCPNLAKCGQYEVIVITT